MRAPQLNVRLDQDESSRVDDLLDRSDRSVTSFARFAVADLVAQLRGSAADGSLQASVQTVLAAYQFDTRISERRLVTVKVDPRISADIDEALSCVKDVSGVDLTRNKLVCVAMRLLLQRPDDELLATLGDPYRASSKDSPVLQRAS